MKTTFGGVFWELWQHLPSISDSLSHLCVAVAGTFFGSKLTGGWGGGGAKSEDSKQLFKALLFILLSFFNRLKNSLINCCYEDTNIILFAIIFASNNCSTHQMPGRLMMMQWDKTKSTYTCSSWYCCHAITLKRWQEFFRKKCLNYAKKIAKT